MDATIGLEVHVQLDTDTKLFCGCETGGADEPNTHTCEVCLGMPGAKPVPNAAVIDAGVRAGLALDCDIADEVVFSRKTYFYPDMSKNFQITQYEQPIAADGAIDIGDREIGIRRAHIEEDPARLVHRGNGGGARTLVDYNRAGTPLLEIVTDPDLDAPEQARTFLQRLTRIMEYLELYDRDRFTVRSDANVSVDGGNRVEVKNITGTKEIVAALEHEVTRQRGIQEQGDTVTRETRRWDADAGQTHALRTKETEEDYGYIHEPDIVPVDIPDERIETAREELPELPGAKRERFRAEHGVGDELADALVTDPALADAFEEAVDAVGAELAASWFSGPIKKTLNYHELSYRDSPLTADRIVAVLEKLDAGELSDQAAETVVRELVEDPRPVDDIIADEGLAKAGGDELAAWAEEAIDENPGAVADYEGGDEEAINFLVGQVMQKSGGSADPKETRELLQERLD